MTVVQGFQLDTHKNYFFNTSKTFLLTRFGLGTFFVALLLILNSAFQLIMTNVVQRSAIVTLIVGIVFLFEGFVVSLIFGELQRRQNRYSNNQQSLRDALMRERVEMFVKEEALKALSFKQTELETERLKADQANKAKSLFLANMSHEIRTPLVSVLGYAELLRDSNISIETARMYGSIIERTGNTLLEIITQKGDEVSLSDVVLANCLPFGKGSLRLVHFGRSHDAIPLRCIAVVCKMALKLKFSERPRDRPQL